MQRIRPRLTGGIGDDVENEEVVQNEGVEEEEQGEPETPPEENGGESPEEIKLTSEQLKDRLERARKAERDKIAEDERKKAEAAAKKQAEENGQFKELYEKLQPEHDALKEQAKSKDERIEALESVVNTTVESRLKELEIPKAYKGFVDQMDTLDKLQWINDNAADLAPASDGSSKQRRSTPRTEQRNDDGPEQLTEEDKRKRAARVSL